MININAKLLPQAAAGKNLPRQRQFKFEYKKGGAAVFQINRYYVIVPQPLYDIFLLGGGLTSLAALGMLVKGIVQKKRKTYFICWILTLSFSGLLFLLSCTGKICGHMMIGG